MVGFCLSNLVFLAFMKQSDSCQHRCQSRHCSTGSEDPWPRLMGQLETSGDIYVKGSCISEGLTNRLPFLILGGLAFPCSRCECMPDHFGSLELVMRCTPSMAGQGGREGVHSPAPSPCFSPCSSCSCRGGWLKLLTHLCVDNVINQNCFH